MHETALAIGLVDLVAEASGRENAQRVSAIHLEIGALSCVELESLEQAIRAATIGGIAEDARLTISRPPGVARCMACGDEVPLLRRGDGCPHCQSHRLLVTGGDALRLLAIEVQ